MLQLIDSHAHLDDDRFRDDLSQVLERAQAAGVIRIVTVATSAATSVANVELALKHPELWATVGIQPNNIAQAGPSDWDQVVSLAQRPGVVALGETGLDRHWNYTSFPMQEDYFARHLELSRGTRLPLVIHCREAEADLLRMLRAEFDRHGPVLGVMHSFTGDLDTAQACLAMGLYLSFAGMLTYKNAQPLRDVAAKMPIERVLVETDSPYLAPVPVRGQRNEPAFVKHTAECLAKVLGVSIKVLAEQTTMNARLLLKGEQSG